MAIPAGIWLLLAIISSASMSIVLKLFQGGTGNRYGILLGNYLTCIVLSWLFIPDKNLLTHPGTITLVCGIIGGFFFVLGLVCMQSSIAANGAILTSAFARLGLLVPLLVSLVCFGERPRLLQIAGICIVLCAMWLIGLPSDASETSASLRQVEPSAHEAPLRRSGSSGKAASSHQAKPSTPGTLQVHLGMLLLVLLCCGSGDAMAKIFEHVGSRSEDSLYIFHVFSSAAVFTLLLLIHEYRCTKKQLHPADLLAGIAVGIPNYFSSALLLKSLVRLPAFVVYPTFSAGAIVLVTLFGVLLFHEKPGKMQWIGLLMIIGAVMLLNV